VRKLPPLPQGLKEGFFMAEIPAFFGAFFSRPQSPSEANRTELRPVRKLPPLPQGLKEQLMFSS